jgi:hypothetical protein
MFGTGWKAEVGSLQPYISVSNPAICEWSAPQRQFFIQEAGKKYGLQIENVPC